MSSRNFSVDAGEVVSVSALFSALSAGVSALAQPNKSPGTRDRVSARVTVFFTVDLFFEGGCTPRVRFSTKKHEMTT